MTQEERRQKRYDEVVDFIDANKRNPSKHRIEEHDMLNWQKANEIRGLFDPFLIKGLKYPVRNKSH